MRFQDFPSNTPISCEVLLLSMADFPKWGVFNDLKGMVMKPFSGGEPTDPQFCSLCLHPVSAPPPPDMNFVLRGLYQMQCGVFSEG